MREATMIVLAASAALAACGDRNATANNMTAPGDLPANAMAANAMANGMSNAISNGAAAGAGATATLQTAQGTPAGTAHVEEVDGVLRVSVHGEGLPAGEHGVHIHMTGKCEAPGFESAGGHWNPADKHHGLDNPQGQHAGDMPNLTVGQDGSGSLDYALKGGTLAGLLDADGAAFVIHAGKDDQKTDPSGQSGGRIACGVFHAG